MSKKILFGTLHTIKLLLFLSTEEFITSSKIRKKFPEISPGTLDAKLRKLKDQGFVEVLEKERERAGDDRLEYKLSKEGAKTKNDLITYNIQILQPVIEKIFKQDHCPDKFTNKKTQEELIHSILMEFSEETAEIINKDHLKQQLDILKNILKKYI